MVRKAPIWTNRYFIAGVILVAVVAGWYVSGGPEKETEGFKTRVVETGEILRVVAASGSVNAVIEVEVGSQISGQIKELFADYNDVVKKGELVALIDPEIYEMRMRQRAAELAIANADLVSRRAQLSSDEAAMLFSKRDMARKQQLFKKGNVSSAMIEAAEMEKQKALDNVQMSKAAIVNSKANIQQRQSTLEQAQVELARTQIRAPIDGVVIERRVDVGQTVAASMQAPTLFRIANDLRDIRVEASVDEADIGQVKSGQVVSFTVDAYPERKFNGDVEVVRLAPEISQNVVTYTVTILARNEDMSLLPGMTANIEIITGRRENVLRVPNEALRFKPRGQNVNASQGMNLDPDSMAKRMMKTYVERLSLDSKQQSALHDDIVIVLKANMPKAGETATGTQGASMRGVMQKVSARIAKKIMDIGTPEQIKAYEILRKEFSHKGGSRGVKRATLWVIDSDGQLQSRQVLIGLSDIGNTQVIKGIEAGEQVIIGYDHRASN